MKFGYSFCPFLYNAAVIPGHLASFYFIFQPPRLHVGLGNCSGFTSHCTGMDRTHTRTRYSETSCSYSRMEEHAGHTMDKHLPLITKLQNCKTNKKTTNKSTDTKVVICLEALSNIAAWQVLLQLNWTNLFFVTHSIKHETMTANSFFS